MIKKMFSTPEKTVFSIICVLVLLIALGTASVFAASAVAGKTSIGAENAELLAYADAGVDPLAAKRTRTEFDFERGQFFYDVEFVANGTEYEYRVQAFDGTVVKKNVEVHVPSGKTSVQPAMEIKEALIPAAAEPQKAEAPVVSDPVYIGVDSAKSIALKDAGLTADAVTFTEARLDTDDLVKNYDLEFFSSDREYDYEINALTGDIIDKSAELLERAPQSVKPAPAPAPAPTPDPTPSSKTYIGVDKAKSAALNHAGVQASAASFSKAKLDNEDGRMVYEIEFYVGRVEYDYEIDAYTGTIIEFDVDND